MAQYNVNIDFWGLQLTSLHCEADVAVIPV